MLPTLSGPAAPGAAPGVSADLVAAAAGSGMRAGLAGDVDRGCRPEAGG